MQKYALTQPKQRIAKTVDFVKENLDEKGKILLYIYRKDAKDVKKIYYKH